MSRLVSTWIARGVWSLLLFASPAVAQGPLRIIQRTPSDTGTPGAEIGVMFDRPVAGAPDRPVDPQRIMRLEPAIAGTAVWRDPVTLRFLPSEALRPGTTLTVTIDTTFAALDGARLAQPYRFAARIPGARPLGHKSGPDAWDFRLAARPALSILYSAPVDLDAMRGRSRIEFEAPCAVRVVELIPTRVRRVRFTDAFEGAFGYDRDTLADQFRRIVELTVRDDLPAGCKGMWHVPSLDPRDPAGTWKYEVETWPPLILDRPSCDPGPRCEPGPARVAIMSPPISSYERVSEREIARRVRVTALRLPRDASDPCAPCAPPTPITLTTELPAGTIYRVTVDSALRDKYGHRLTGVHQRIDTVGNYYARTWSPRGVATVPRNARSVRVEYVNAETLTVEAVPIPDRYRTRLMAASSVERLALFRDTLRPAMRDTFRLDVAVSAPRDARTAVVLPLPPQVGAPGSPAFYAVHVWVKTARTVSPVLHADAVGRVARSPERIPITANEDPWANAPRVGAGADTTFLPWRENWDHPLGLLLQVSDLAVHTKLTGDSGAVFVSSLATGGPLEGVDLTLYDADRRALAHARTNADGLSRLVRTAEPVATSRVVRDPKRSEARYIEARRGADTLLLGVAGSLAGRLPTNGDGADDPLAYGTIITDRDIYRPGEMLYAKIIARTGALGALTAPGGDSIRWRLTDWSGEEVDTVWQRTTVLSRFGTATDSIRLPAALKPGGYTMEGELRRHGEWARVATTDVYVEEYRAPELDVTIDVDSTTPLREGTLSVPVRARYLFGAPVVGAPVHWWARVVVQASPLPQVLADSEYVAGSPEGYWEEWAATVGKAMNGSATTDSSGDVLVRVPLASRIVGTDGALLISAAVTDAGNQAVTAMRSIPLEPPPFHIAVRRATIGWPAEVGTRQEFHILALAPDGSRMSDLTVRIRVVHQRCRSNEDADGRELPQTCTADTISRASVTTRTTPVTAGFTPDSVGRHDVVFEATDRAGRTAMTVLAWIMADTTSARYRWVPPPLPPALELRADSAPRPLGDTALVRFDSPFALADAWVTREREGVMEQRHMTVSRGPVTLRMPITERDAPSVWVGVMLIPRERGLRTDVGPVDSITRIGYVELVVDSTVKRLRVDVSSRDTVYEPGDTAVLRVRVRDGAASSSGRGVRSEVAVWAVDEGVLSLTGFETPAVLSRLYERRGIGASLQTVFSRRWWQLDGSLMSRYALLDRLSSSAVQQRGVMVGGADLSRGGMLEANTVPVATLRSDFRTTAFFLGAVVTDDSGRAEVRARLPDNITTYRLMAVAVTEGDRYGSGEGKLVATRPLVARAALPRFVRRGDELTAGAMLNARDGRADRLDVVSSATGVELRGSATASVAMAAGATGRARFAYAVSPTATADTARIRFTVSGTAGADAVEATLPIRPAYSPRAHTVAGVLTGSSAVTMMLPAGIDPDRSRVSISLGTSPLAAIRSNYERLRDYPYRSSDAIASGGSALLALARTERALGVSVSGIDSANILGDLQRAVDELALRELDGWIVYWRLPDWHPHTNAWLTAYAGTFLLEAQRAGATVRPSLLRAIRAKLTDVARDSIEVLHPDTITGSPEDRRWRRRAWLASRVVAARFIRDAGAPDSSAELSLLRLAPLMSWEDRLVLADLVGARGDATRARRMLDSAWMAVGAVGKRIELPDSLRSVGSSLSHIRPAARLLTATMRLQPTHPGIGALVETVTQQGRAEQRWAWNTQDYAAASTALAAFAVAQRGSGARQLTARAENGATLLTRTVGAEAAGSSAPLTGLLRQAGDSARLTLALSSSETSTGSPLYYAITVNEIPRARPITPDIKGIVVERWFESFATGAPVSEVAEGDLVRVRLRVTVPADRQFVVLEDLLPAGLEAVDLSLRTSSTLSPFATSEYSRSRAGSSMESTGPILPTLIYGSWDGGWWSPWEDKEMHDDRVTWFARQLWTGSYTATYIARATTAGRFVLPPAHAEEMYDRAVQGRSGGGVLVVRPSPPR